jgi:glutathione S-transferase
LELYHNNMSTCAQKVRLVLAEKDLQPIEHHLNLRAGEQNSPEYLQLNPKGVVPTLVDHGQVIIESTVICEYLDDAYPQVPLRPADPLQRARMRRWTILPDAGFHHSVGLTCVAIAFRHQILAKGPEMTANYLAGRPDHVQRERMRALLEQGLEAPDVAQAIRDYDRFIGQLAQQLSRTPLLAGAQFSLADAMALPYVVRLEHLGYQWWWTGAGAARAPIVDWLARCKVRPSYRAIADYLDPAYLELMPRTGAAERPRVEAILASR